MTRPEQLRAARSLLGITQSEIAAAAGVSVITVKRAEGSGTPAASAAAVAAVRGALEAAGVVFIDQNGGGPGVRLARPQAGA